MSGAPGEQIMARTTLRRPRPGHRAIPNSTARRRSAPERPVDGEAGVVAVWFSMLLFVFVGLAALGVDVGSWYLRAQNLQRAADAAALAAVVYMPDQTKAYTAALDSLSRNGIDPAKVAVSTSAGYHDRQYRVALTDAAVPTFFGRMMANRVTVKRSALAEFTAPVPMGSPQNYLGWGGAALALSSGLPASAATPNYWLSLNGYCMAKEQGDLFSARYDGTAYIANGAAVYGCGTTAPTSTYYEDQAVVALPGQLPSYRSQGYTYAIKAPTGSTTVSLYDPAFCPDVVGAIDKPKSTDLPGVMVPLAYVLHAPDTAGTPSDATDDPVIASGTFSTCTSAMTWVPIATVTTAGEYLIQISTPPAAMSLGANSFSLRATNGSTALCDARINGASCPQVSGRTAISTFALVTGSTATFSLAEVASAYAGKQIVIGLWDPGEGLTQMRVLDPSGNAVPFRLRVTPTFDGSSPTFSSSSQTALDVSGCGSAYPQPGPYRIGSCRYNDRLVELLVDVPTTYTGGWWSVEYTAGTAPTDRTTWTVRVIGDPVHLTRD